MYAGYAGQPSGPYCADPSGRAPVAPQVDRTDADAELEQPRHERGVALDVTLSVLGEAVLEQQDRARLRRVPRVAPNTGADVPVAEPAVGAQGARFACDKPR